VDVTTLSRSAYCIQSHLVIAGGCSEVAESGQPTNSYSMNFLMISTRLCDHLVPPTAL
jgi:hypothetical protein